ncbi:MAG: cyclic nucleotide-binding domain-containing protein [Gammaproteobacteria bacterium]|jgi:CRP-like cAMP-binding protein
MATAQKFSTTVSSPRVEQLRDFVPVYTLDPERQQELARHARCISLPAGSRLFSIGDSDNNILYLLSGEIELSNPEERMRIQAGTELAMLPLDPHQPHKHTGILRSNAEIIMIERNLMDILLTWNPYSGYVVDEIDALQCDPDDWMASILQSPVFQRIPPINIQTMFLKLQTCQVREHDIIFRQGDEGDYFYLIRQGTCNVMRSNHGTDTSVAELKPGQSFGEEALLSKAPRNATVSMKTDGVLVRLSKQDFAKLLEQPVVETINLEQAETLYSRNPAWIDVRQPEEHYLSAIEDSLNIPLSQLRDRLQEIDRDRPCIVYCDNAHRSSCAVYLLNAYGYEAYVLEYGIQNAEQV